MRQLFRSSLLMLVCLLVPRYKLLVSCINLSFNLFLDISSKKNIYIYIYIHIFFAFSLLQCALDVRTRLSSLELQHLFATSYKDGLLVCFVCVGDFLLLVLLEAKNNLLAGMNSVLLEGRMDLLHCV